MQRSFLTRFKISLRLCEERFHKEMVPPALICAPGRLGAEAPLLARALRSPGYRSDGSCYPPSMHRLVPSPKPLPKALSKQALIYCVLARVEG